MLWLYAIAALLSLNACLSGISPGFAILASTTATFIQTDKLPSDIIASAITGLDCSALLQYQDNGPLCRSPDYGKVIERPLYCYRTLAQITCYEEPDPYGNGARRIQ